MNPWPFIIASYVIGLGATGVLTGWAYLSMRKAEGEAERLRGRE